MTKKLLVILLAASAALGARGASKTYSVITNGIEWTYAVNNDCATLSRCKTRLVSGHVDIPLSLGGYPVTAIGTGAFSGCHNMSSIQIPESVTSIGNVAFTDCISLTSVFIPKGVVEIGNGAFQHCDNMSSIVVDEDNASFCVVDGLLCNKDVSEIVSCPGALHAVAIPKTVTRIRSRAFMGCGWLTQIVIPKSVVYIGAGAFGSCGRLETITLETGNTSYCVANGILCDNLVRTTIACPGGLDSVSLPSSVTDIGDYSFEGCARLSSITIPSNVNKVGISAFSGCSGLREIRIEEGLVYIDEGAFQSCSLLGDIVIPSTVSKIGGLAFWNCSLRVYYCSTMPPLCDGYIYDDSMTVVSYVPRSWNLADELWQGMSWEYWNPSTGGAGGGSSVVAVIFDAAGGYVDESSRSVEKGMSLGTLPAYSRKGYTFDGWYSEPVGGIKIAASTKVTGNMTCYAHATPIRYTVRFNANGGVGSMSDQEFAYDEEKELSRNQFVMAGRTFLGWSRRSSGYVNLFDPFDFYPDEEEVANLAEKSGEIVNLYAVWSDPSRASTFRLSKTVDDGYVWTTSVTVYRGESHLFWIEGVVRDDDCGLDLDVVACDDDSLYASEYWKFENAQGGHDHYVLLSEDDWMWSNISASAVRFRVTVSAWDSCANSTLRFGHMSGSIPVELTWRVTFDPGEGDLDWHGAMPVGYAKTVEYKNNAALGTLEVPTRSRYKFLGWFTSESGGTKVTASTKVTADVTYYAHWERNSSRCVATLDANGGECDVASVDTVWNKPFGELPVAVRWGYLFAGWYTDPEFGIRVDETSIVEDDVVLYAHWSLIHGQFEAGKMYGRNDSGAQAEDWRTVFEYARRSHVPIVFLIGGKECVWCRKVHDAFLDSGEWEVPCIMYYDYYTNNPRPAEYALFGNFQWDGGTFPALCCYWNIGDGKSVMKAVSLMNGSYGRCIDSDNATIDKNLILQIIEATFECPLANATDEQPILLYPPDKTTNSDGYVLIRLTEYAISDSQLKFTVKGLPSGVKFDAKTGVISGTATKPGVYKVTVSATNATVKKPVTAEFEIVVPNLTSEKLPGLEQDKDAYGVVMCGVALPTDLVDCTPEAGWTVKVAGLPAGLKFTAKDIMKKGSKTEVEIPANTIYGVPTKTGTFTVTFTATKGKEKQVATITLNVEELPLWAQGTFTGYVAGTRDACPYRGFATMTVAANGKISGKIALDGTNWTFSAASFSRVEHVERVEGGVATNFAVEAVAKAGKVERKVALEVSGHAGRVTLPGGGFIETALPNAVAGGTFGEGEVKMWRGMWKDKATAAAAKTAIEKFIGVYTVSIADGADYGSGYLSLTVGKDGNVKASGKLADGTSVSATSPLMCDEDAGWLVMLYAAPSAYKGGAFAAAVGFYADDAAVAGRPPYRLTPALFAPQWSSRNVQATDEYGEGFDRAVGLVGAYYDKLDTLRKYYESMRVRLDDTPELFFSYKGTYLDENNRKVTETFLDSVWAVDTLDQPGLTAAVNEKGAIVVEKATKPVQDKATREWLYEGRNDGALTLSFTQATGIFKGSYTFWYDYESAYDETTGKSTMVHTSKKVSFEGILVQGEEPVMDGFYLWDATGEYDDAKTGKTKTYKYKQSFPVSLRQ